MSRCYFFGCWNEPGHYLHSSGRGSVDYQARQQIEHYGDGLHIDGTLAPRRNREGGICWEGQGKTHDERGRIKSNSGECAQGQYLLHVLPNGFTVIQWWDRCQGDKRGACNSTILLEGTHAADEMVAALGRHFPHVLENLKKHGVELVNVTP